jgi:hypothetical protein
MVLVLVAMVGHLVLIQQLLWLMAVLLVVLVCLDQAVRAVLALVAGMAVV